MTLAVCIRVYPGISKEPIIKGPKLSTFQKCLNSFLQGLDSFSFVDISILTDNCDELFLKGIKDVCIENPNRVFCFVDSSKTGNQNTFLQQIEILSKKKADFLMFLEDDYYFLPNWSLSFFELVNKVGNDKCFFSGYRSSDYEHDFFHIYKKVKRSNLSEVSTTLSFIVSSSIFFNYKKVFMTFSKGNFDSVLWLNITDKFALRRLFIVFIFNHDLISFKKLVKYILFFKHVKKIPLYVPLYSFMIHLEKRGFPIFLLDKIQ